jgi:hypothetical protein
MDAPAVNTILVQIVIIIIVYLAQVASIVLAMTNHTSVQVARIRLEAQPLAQVVQPVVTRPTLDQVVAIIVPQICISP